MKKNILSVLLAVTCCVGGLLSLGGCRQVETVPAETLDRIYERECVNWYPSLDIRYSHRISSEPVVTTEAVEECREFSYLGKTFLLTYDRTVYRPDWQIRYHQYTDRESGKETFLFREDGRLFMVLHPDLPSISIQETDSGERVAELLLEQFPGLIEKDSYPKLEIKTHRPNPDYPPSYTFCWYQSCGAYRGENRVVTVKEDGALSSVAYHDLDFDMSEVHLDVDRAYEDTLIKAKLYQLFCHNGQTYTAYERSGTELLTVYDNTLCVLYPIAVEGKQRAKEPYFSVTLELYIPVELLNQS